ncbi:alpha/beta-hydrolase [Amniculicola lignicola CBS 123094]|uniref:Alpha/beta-hydrolase n=1 Tax=Amniculicola lignicola CBS 123094 TaxID=1392246 RepID=A0A6A5WFQ1_9PLEO|nr:alpha/beta-hydrolase [Amniculicola lignicola CBS 123094]
MIFVLSVVLTVLLLCTSGSVAAPAAHFFDERAPTVSDALLKTFNLMEQYAGAAYCPGNTNKGSIGTEVECKPDGGICPVAEQAKTDTLTEFQDQFKTDVTGYVALDSSNSLLIVAFRGSRTQKNWLANIDMVSTDTDICKGCTAHHGFWTSWTEARSGVLGAIKNATLSYPNYKLVVVGHSLGGAIATLAAAELRASGHQATLYTFGAPRVSSDTLSSFVTNQPGGNFRLTHWNDPVPRVPPILFGYTHISPEYYIAQPNGVNVATKDIKVYEGSRNLKGNGAWIIQDFDAHRWYFGKIPICTGEPVKGRAIEKRGLKDGVEILADF